MKYIRDTESWKWLRTAGEIVLIIIAAVIVVFLLRSIGIAEGKYVLCMDRVNIRMGASSRSDQVGWLEPGDIVYPDGRKRNGFIHCEIPQIEAGEGWIHQGYLVEEKPERINCSGTVTGNGKVKARKYVDGKRTRWLKPGGELRVYWWTDEWCLTSCGYVRSEFIELDGE